MSQKEDLRVPAKTETKDAALATKGRALFKAQNCNGCHGEDGLKGQGGPSLANLWKEHPDAEYTMRYVKNPQSIQKGSTMPAYGTLKEEELQALAPELLFSSVGPVVEAAPRLDSIQGHRSPRGESTSPP